jgi:hypothetical protein
VSAWTTGGNVQNATIRLQATPAVGGAPGFTFGCGSDDGTSSCDLGAMDAQSAQRQLQAQLTIPVTASTIKSVTLTATGSAANLPADPKASAAVAVTAPAKSKSAVTSPSATQTPQVPEEVTSPLPVGTLPNIPATSPSFIPGGNAAGLFPTLAPKPTRISVQRAHTRPVANTTALPEGAPIAGAQIVGLAALALAFVLAVTRLSIRRRPGAKPGAQAAAAADTSAKPSGQPEEQPDTAEAPSDTPDADGK